MLDGAVNKRDLSTGETGEFASKNAGFDLNPRVERAVPRTLLSSRRKVAGAKTCGMLGIQAGRGMVLLSTKRALEVGAETVWLPA
jgi:hypothetical protein